MLASLGSVFRLCFFHHNEIADSPPVNTLVEKQILEYLEDTRLTVEEKKLLDESIVKIKSGNKSGFISHAELKKKLGF